MAANKPLPVQNRPPLIDPKSTAGKIISNVVPALMGGGLLAKGAEEAGAAVAAKVGDKVAQKVAESTPAGKLGTAGGETKIVKVNPDKPVTVSRTADKTKVVTTSPSKVEATTPKRTMDQRLGDQQRGDTKRFNAVEGAKTNATSAAKSVTTSASMADRAKGAAVGFIAGRATPSQPTATSNPIRLAGDSTTKVHPDNKPITGNR
jgi:hypothetical protein